MKNKRFWFVGPAAILALALLASSSAGVAQQAQAPAGVTLPYAGRLVEEAGGPVSDGLYDLQFELYVSETGGAASWSETHAGVAVSGGAFAVVLGDTNPLPKDAGQGSWLQVGVRGPGQTAYANLLPRQRLFDASAGYEDAAVSCQHNHTGEAWTINNATYALRVENTGTGDGIRGVAYTNASDYAGIVGVNYLGGPGVYGNGFGGGPGVAGYSTGRGVYGKGVDGVVGESTTAYKSGVYGLFSGASDGYGITGRGESNFGVFAWGNDSNLQDQKGDILLQGANGEIFATGTYLDLYTNGSMWIDLDNDNNTANAYFEILNGSNSSLWFVSESSGIVSSVKQASLVDTASQGQRLMYAVEGTGVWLEDLGTATMGANGEISIAFDAVYAEAADLSQDYQVFVTPLSGEPVILYVSAKTPTGFSVRGVTLDGKPAACALDYRVVAPRLGYSGLRTELYAAPEMVEKGLP